MIIVLRLLLVLLPHVVAAQFQSLHNFWPAAYPLAVRSPYLNAWYPVTNNTNRLGVQPVHWDLFSNMGWAGLVRVDEVSYGWLGTIDNVTVIQSSQVTPTRTNFIVKAGPVLLNATFLSPIEPNNLVKQSLPFAYLSVDVSSTDGKPHSVQIYSDITAEWVSGDRTKIAQWNTTQTKQSVYHSVFLQSPQSMQENHSIAEDSTVYYGMKQVDNLSWQSGASASVRVQFINEGSLTGGFDNDFRAIDDNFVVFGIAVQLGTITSTSSPIVWGLGLVRDPVINDQAGPATAQRSSYFWTKYSTIGDAIDDFLGDFPNALQRAVSFDNKLTSAATSISSDYSDIISLGLRQGIASIDFTVPKSDLGWNASDVKAYMKDIGDSRRVTPLDTLYAALPMILYVNASWAGYLLKPVLEFQTTLPQRDFAIPDIGSNYPLVDGDSPLANSAIEYSGDALIIAWAHAAYSGDGRLIDTYYNLFKGWAGYLSTHSSSPSGQALDGLVKDNSTNLAIKGIIAIRCFAAMSQALNHADDFTQYSNTATTLAQQWNTLSFGRSGHISSTYDASSSPALIYNLFGDKLFKFGLVGDEVYKAQNDFYASQVQGLSSSNKFGIPFDSSGVVAKSHWTMFTAATLTDTTLRNTFVSMVRTRANSNSTAGFPATYDVRTGFSDTGLASPALGGLFALLALILSPAGTISVTTGDDGDNPQSPNSSSSSSKAGPIAGGVIGGLLAVALIIGAIFFIRRRRRQSEDTSATVSPFSPTKKEEGATTTQNTGRGASSNIVTHQTSSKSGASDSRIPSTSALVPTTSSSSTEGASSRKEREGRQERTILVSSTTGTPPSSAAPTVPSPSLGVAAADSAENSRLRQEIEHLRREVDEIRSVRDPPPSYTD